MKLIQSSIGTNLIVFFLNRLKNDPYAFAEIGIY